MTIFVEIRPPLGDIAGMKRRFPPVPIPPVPTPPSGALAALALAALVTACREETAAVPPPSQDCICARACGIPVVAESYWVNAQGQAVALGYCPPLHDEILNENRSRCQCAQPVPGMGTLPQSRPPAPAATN